MTLQTATPPDGLEYRLLLTVHLQTIRVPRKLVEIALDNWGLGRLKDRASTIVSELVTNSLIAVPGSEIEVGAYLEDGWVRLEVWDESPVIPNIPDHVNLTDVGGRGLYVVDQMADKFGFEIAELGGKTARAMLHCASVEATDAT